MFTLSFKNQAKVDFLLSLSRNFRKKYLQMDSLLRKMEKSKILSETSENSKIDEKLTELIYNS